MVLVLLLDLYQPLDVVLVNFDFLVFGFDLFLMTLVLVPTTVLLLQRYWFLNRNEDADLALQDYEELVSIVSVVEDH